jgi:hypothetical protein
MCVLTNSFAKSLRLLIEGSDSPLSQLNVVNERQIKNNKGFFFIVIKKEGSFLITLTLFFVKTLEGTENYTDV